MSAGGQPGSGANKMRANRPVLESKCTSCSRGFVFGAEVYSCPICAGYHHAACWESGSACQGGSVESASAALPSLHPDPLSPAEPTVPVSRAELGTSLKCPHCGLLSPAFAQWCDCGYDFQTRSFTKSPPAHPEHSPLSDGEQYCSHCSNVIKTEALKCRFCGRALRELALQEVPAYVVTDMKKSANQALTSAIVGLFICAPVLGPMAISNGNKAIKLMDQYPTYPGPRGKAQAGRVIGWIDLVLFVVFVIGRVASFR